MRSPKPILSVIIPTYNRSNVLSKTLQAYSAQDDYGRILEVLVVDDGSTDQTRPAIEELSRTSRINIRYLYQTNMGLAAARNHGIREAQGELMLFGDDDIIPARDMVNEHLKWHREHPDPQVGVLGHVGWAPEVRATPFMVWAGLYGPQFQFGYFTPGAELEFIYGYFCNTSVKSSFLRQQGIFDENLRGYGWEDIEFSYRLYKAGWRLRYNPDAIGYHHKFETFSQNLHRVEQVWCKSWSVFLKTEAGLRFYDILCAQRANSMPPKKNMLRRHLGSLKKAAAPLLRPLMDTRLKLPDRCYDFTWYHYSKPLIDAAFSHLGNVERDSGHEMSPSSAGGRV
jgi:GT2 family glycosyltransferase